MGQVTRAFLCFGLDLLICHCCFASVLDLGVTAIEGASFTAGEMSIIDDAVYVSVSSRGAGQRGQGVWRVSADDSSFVEVSAFTPAGSGDLQLTSATGTDDQGVLVAVTETETGSFDKIPIQGKLVEIGTVATERFSWDEPIKAVGVTSSGRVVGNWYEFGYEFPVSFSDPFAFTEYENDGPGTIANVQYVASTGDSAGFYQGAGSLGFGTVFWDTAGNVTFFGGAGTFSGFSERSDSMDTNYAVNRGVLLLQAGDIGPLGVAIDALVTHTTSSDFFAFSPDEGDPVSDVIAYFPGIMSGSSTLGLPLLDVVPDLAAVSDHALLDVVADGDKLLFLVSSNSEVSIISTLNPTIIPEPSSMLVLVACCIAPLCSTRLVVDRSAADGATPLRGIAPYLVARF